MPSLELFHLYSGLIWCFKVIFLLNLFKIKGYFEYIDFHVTVWHNYNFTACSAVVAQSQYKILVGFLYSVHLYCMEQLSKFWQ